MKETKVTFETAKLAEQKGFTFDHNFLPSKIFTIMPNGEQVDIRKYDVDEILNDGRHLHGSTQTLLQKWLREEQGVIVWVNPHPLSSGGGWAYNIRNWDSGTLKDEITNEASDVLLEFEEALEEGLQKALQLL